MTVRSVGELRPKIKISILVAAQFTKDLVRVAVQSDLKKRLCLGSFLPTKLTQVETAASF